MKNNVFLLRIHRFLWFAITILTGILAGFLTSHSIMLGRYFTWLIESGNFQVFTDTFSLFREATNANIHYNYFIWASFTVGFLWTVFSFLVRRDRIVALIAGLSTSWVGCVFYISGFSSAEEAVCTGTASESVRQFFVSWNIPMHTSFAVFYTLCFLLLLFTGCRSYRKDNLGSPA